MFNDFRGILEDPDFTEEIVLYRGGAVDTNEDGVEEFQFGPPERMEALVCSPDASPYEVAPRGPEEVKEFAMCVMMDRNITGGDRIIYDTGFGEAPFQAVEPRPTRFDGEEFVWFRLVPDERGEEAPGDDSPDDGTDEPVDDPYGTW